jgi:Histidine kinase
MISHDFIFSDKKSTRIKRHLLFWFLWYIYYAVLHAANPFGAEEISYFKNPVFTFTESFLFILCQMPLVYCMLYLILPEFILKKKYLAALLGTALLWFLGGVWHVYLFKDIHPQILAYMLPGRFLENTQRPESTSLFMAMMGTYKGAFTGAAFALVIKVGKHWYQKEQRNLQLQKENTDAQLQLLTAQVHPHFLFNTLNNIFSKTQTESPGGSKMIMGLSEMLRYILYEGQKPLVPLKQELLMITEYISLEKIRYGNKLDVHLMVPDKMDDIYIAPLLLLPFLENCFKHGASNMLQNPWINFTVEVKDTLLVMKLMNGKAAVNENLIPRLGIGINNVRQRLDLLYKDKYDLQIREQEDVFVVDLKVQLIKLKNTPTEDFVRESLPNPAYA